ncbi:hypothetical protein CTAYLR_004304 [Chrysophaeum taylorii]|uniref:peptidylprolyl isomerase n=1 Tax=Chrysophaeum taylorii TaxID=2483200 RepID=A0AAD7UI83_9STRA|nr:hypothetical protein CTAYLR_004304 [Chrysophaeum taylorii]
MLRPRPRRRAVETCLGVAMLVATACAYGIAYAREAGAHEACRLALAEAQARIALLEAPTKQDPFDCYLDDCGGGAPPQRSAAAAPEEIIGGNVVPLWRAASVVVAPSDAISASFYEEPIELFTRGTLKRRDGGARLERALNKTQHAEPCDIVSAEETLAEVERRLAGTAVGCVAGATRKQQLSWVKRKPGRIAFSVAGFEHVACDPKLASLRARIAATRDAGFSSAVVVCADAACQKAACAAGLPAVAATARIAEFAAPAAPRDAAAFDFAADLASRGIRSLCVGMDTFFAPRRAGAALELDLEENARPVRLATRQASKGVPCRSLFFAAEASNSSSALRRLARVARALVVDGPAYARAVAAQLELDNIASGGRLSPLVVACAPRPRFVLSQHERLAAVVLEAPPKTNPASRKLLASELGLVAPRRAKKLLALKGASISLYENELEFARLVVAHLVATALVTNRALVLPSIHLDEKVFFLWTYLDLESLDTLNVAWHETHFLSRVPVATVAHLTVDLHMAALDTDGTREVFDADSPDEALLALALDQKADLLLLDLPFLRHHTPSPVSRHLRWCDRGLDPAKDARLAAASHACSVPGDTLESEPPEMREMFEDFDMNTDMDKLMAQLKGNSNPSGPKDRGSGPNYSWEQTRETMSLMVDVGEAAASDIVVEVTPRTIEVRIRGEARVSGDLGGDALKDDTFWVLEEDGTLVVDIAKKSQRSWTGLLSTEGDATYARVTRTVYLDVEINGTAAGRVELGLFGDDLPKTVDNFVALCEGRGGVPSFAGTPFHRVIPGFVAQAGDVTNRDGTGGVSIYDGPFKDERFLFRHDKEGLLSMANSGPDSNKSQFFCTLAACSWLDDKHVIFGRVLKGMDVLRAIEACGSADGTPLGSVLISASGSLEPSAGDDVV